MSDATETTGRAAPGLPECKKCYGKGYSSEYGGGTRWLGDFTDHEGGTPHSYQIHFCSCERGKDLKKYVRVYVRKEAEAFLRVLIMRLSESDGNERGGPQAIMRQALEDTFPRS